MAKQYRVLVGFHVAPAPDGGLGQRFDAGQVITRADLPWPTVEAESLVEQGLLTPVLGRPSKGASSRPDTAGGE